MREQLLNFLRTPLLPLYLNNHTVTIRKKGSLLLLLLGLFIQMQGQGFLHVDGTSIVNGDGENVILRGVGTGNWMLMEGYMMESSGVVDTHQQFRDSLTANIGEVKTDSFYNVWLANHMTKRDVDSLAAWGYNSVRPALHYKWFTLPIEDEPVPGEHTWLDEGFELLDSLLAWCSEHEIYVILDLHGAPGGQGKDAAISDYDPTKPSLWESQENKDKTIALWAKLAERYSDEPWIGGYDLINETNWDFGSEGNYPLLLLYRQITNAIRLVDTNHILFIEGNWFANDFSGLTPPWDDNMVYSFHKYGTYNNSEQIQWMLDIRREHGIPVWLGETGENSNTWFTNMIRMCESENIGWSLWPLKKARFNNSFNVTVNDSYRALIDSWGDPKLKMEEEEAFQAVLEFAANHRLENCFYQRDVVDAVSRQPYTTETLPFSERRTGDVIFASDFDLGRNQHAYLDSDTGSYQYNQDGKFTNWNRGWVYRNDGVDLETCDDALLNNGYSVSYIDSGEWLKYTLQSDSAASYTLELRYASGHDDGASFHVEINGADASGSQSLASTGGWYNWTTTSIDGIILPRGKVELKIVFDVAGMNLNYFKIKDPVALEEEPFRFVSAVTDALEDKVYITLNKSITSPSGTLNAGDFTLFLDGSGSPLDSCRVSESDLKIMELFSSEVLYSNDDLRISYRGSDILHEGEPLETFAFKNVTNLLSQHSDVPGKIEAEDYYHIEGLELEECLDVGGGMNTAYADPGDYLDYIISVEEAGNYSLDFRVATQMSDARLTVQVDQGEGFQSLKTVSFSSTGGWQNWTTQSSEVSLDAGKYMLRLKVSGGEHNLNWFEFTRIVSTHDRVSGLDIHIFPNPANNYLHVRVPADSQGPYTMDLIDLAGRVLFSDQFSTSEYILDTGDYIPGLYFLRFGMRDEYQLMKFIIDRS